MGKKLHDTVVCNSCQVRIGTIYEAQTPDRVGFFTNVCDPNPMPTYCPTCKSPLTRILNN